jgi:Family of unknown function (DUF5652)
MQNLIHQPWFIVLIIVLALWEAAWKLIALWKSARNNQLPWFICIGIFNTVGILPIIYILFFSRKEPATALTS